MDGTHHRVGVRKETHEIKSASGTVTHALVAADTTVEICLQRWIGRNAQGAVGGDLVSQFGVAAEAVVLQHLGIGRFDADGFHEIQEGEGLRVVVAVAGLHEELVRDVVVRQMTVVASGHFVMGAMLPPVEVLAHDVAVHADRWIIG